MDITHTTLVSLRNDISQKKTTAVKAVKAYLDRIERLNGRLNAYNEVYADRALDRAQKVDAGAITGPLAGVPIAIKDNMCTSYGRTTCSSKILANFRAPYDATAVARLEAAGAIVLGKTILDEFAMGSSTENSAVGPSRNPWDTDRVPGGSSGGASSAMAADLCAGSLGSDTGGSIRQPAALCGIVGFKPSYGMISRYGLVAFASSLDQIGPFAHTVEDVALLTQIMAGHDPLDSTSATAQVPDFAGQVNTPVAGLRIAVARQYLSDANDPSVKSAIDAALDALKKQGASVVEVDLPHTEYGIPTYYIVATAEASSNLARYDGVRYGHRSTKAEDLVDLYCRSRAEGFGPEVKRRIMLGTYVLSAGYSDRYYMQALKARRLIKNDFDAAFRSCDAILCPTTTGPAFKFGAKTDNPLEMYMQDVYTVNANLAGIPGVSLPYGFARADGRDLPIGLQLLGPAFDDGKLLRIARMLEATADFHARRPSL